MAEMVACPAPPARLSQSLPAPQALAALTSCASVDQYKLLAAEHIMRFNADHTFGGKLPGMLPAVVVLSITVNEDGAITDALVQRPPSQDDGESALALASLRRTGLLPKPGNLATGPGRTLVYCETFLFNADMRFQLRTLAPPQIAD